MSPSPPSLHEPPSISQPFGQFSPCPLWSLTEFLEHTPKPSNNTTQVCGFVFNCLLLHLSSIILSTLFQTVQSILEWLHAGQVDAAELIGWAHKPRSNFTYAQAGQPDQMHCFAGVTGQVASGLSAHCPDCNHPKPSQPALENPGLCPICNCPVFCPESCCKCAIFW